VDIAVAFGRRADERTWRRALVTTVESLAEMRNALGLGQGQPRRSDALTRHARRAFTGSAGVSEFLLDTWHERRNQLSAQKEPEHRSSRHPAAWWQRSDGTPRATVGCRIRFKATEPCLAAGVERIRGTLAKR
jgi:hypothetical protein